MVWYGSKPSAACNSHYTLISYCTLRSAAHKYVGVWVSGCLLSLISPNLPLRQLEAEPDACSATVHSRMIQGASYLCITQIRSKD